MYTFIWDVEKALCYLKPLPAHKDLLDKELTLKLTMMLDLTATSWYLESSYFHIYFMVRAEEKNIFNFNKLK